MQIDVTLVSDLKPEPNIALCPVHSRIIRNVNEEE
jgi:hypothetical protein